MLLSLILHIIEWFFKTRLFPMNSLLCQKYFLESATYFHGKLLDFGKDKC